MQVGRYKHFLKILLPMQKNCNLFKYDLMNTSRKPKLKTTTMSKACHGF